MSMMKRNVHFVGTAPPLYCALGQQQPNRITLQANHRGDWLRLHHVLLIKLADDHEKGTYNCISVDHALDAKQHSTSSLRPPL